jgi:sugar phosphate isomerase/epimerase
MTHSLHHPTRRQFLGGLAAAACGGPARPAATEFQVACMTYVYRAFPLQRALAGIAAAGYRYVAWGTEHREDGDRRAPVLAPEAPPAAAERLARRCRDLGLEPLMLFSTIYPEHRDGLEVLRRRIEQAHAARVPQVLTFGHTEKGGRALWEERFRLLGREARAAGVTLVIKQHGGETGTGEACAAFTRALADPAVKVNFDAGNVMDYLNVDPIPDLQKCRDEVRSFCIKDHRNFPKDEDCGPGYGEIDHYRLLAAVARLGGVMPLCCENISPPLLPPATTAAEVDGHARRAREFLETVIAGLRRAG